MLLKPNYNLESIYDIDIEELRSVKIRALFFDLDSTIMKSKTGKFAYKTLQFLDDLSSNFKLAIITNNKNVEYIEKVKAQTTIPVYFDAKKPKTDTIFKACEDLGIDPTNAAIVGDRPLSDILAGVRANICTILVDSIAKDDENFLVRFVRFLERLTISK